jgi:FixJ family two-component response regulator
MMKPAARAKRAGAVDVLDKTSAVETLLPSIRAAVAAGVTGAARRPRHERGQGR